MTRQLSNEELFHFCEQLSIVLQSGLPAAEGLRILWEESEEAEDRTFLQDLLDRIDATGDFSGSLSDSGAFPSSMISYIRLGEQTGTLDEVMDSLALTAQTAVIGTIAGSGGLAIWAVFKALRGILISVSNGASGSTSAFAGLLNGQKDYDGVRYAIKAGIGMALAASVLAFVLIQFFAEGISDL